MSKKIMISALAATLALATGAQAPAATKKKIVKPVQSEKSAEKEVMDELVLGVAVGVLGGAMKKAKLPKGGKLIMKQGLKAIKASAKKDGKKDSGKKSNAIKLLLGGDDD